MSVLSVKNYKDKVVIGADTQVTRWMNMEKITKLFKDPKQDLYYGCAGSCSEITAFQVFLETHKPADNSIRSLHEFFTNFVLFKKSFTDKFELDNYYLIVFEKTPYFVEDSLYISEIKEGEYESIGAGFVEANTAMKLGKGVKTALEIACDMNIYCNKPVDIYTIKK